MNYGYERFFYFIFLYFIENIKDDNVHNNEKYLKRLFYNIKHLNQRYIQWRAQRYIRVCKGMIKEKGRLSQVKGGC